MIWFSPFFFALGLAPGLGAAPVEISFGIKQSRVALNQPQILAFTAPSSAETQTWETRIEPAEAAQILQPATLLPNEKTGFLRLRALRPGKAVLQVGSRRLPIEIGTEGATAIAPKSPEIITPRGGARLFGTVAVGVQLQLARPDEPLPEVRLRVSDANLLEPREQTLPPEAMDRIFAFDLDVDQFPAGPLKLQSVVRYPDGRETVSEPVYAYAIRPNESARVAGACIETIHSPRPERLGERLPKIEAAKPNAPDGYVVNNSPDPAWCLPQKITEAGYYQFYLTARGTPAAGSYPSVGLILGDKDRPEASTRLLGRNWHRVAVGQPVYLAAGDHILTARYLNDFQAGKNVDRNLHLARYELVRVSNAPAQEGASESMMASPAMMDSPMMSPVADGAVMAGGSGAIQVTGERPLSVAFSQPFHGLLVAGPVQILAQVNWTNGLPPPRVDLLINGKPAASQYGPEPAFRVPAEALVRGPNALQLRAEMANGIVEVSPIQTLVRPEVAGAPEGAVPRTLRYHVLDPAWDPGMAPRLEKLKGGVVPDTAGFYSNGESILQLPEGLAGEFKVRIDARGQDFKGPPIAELFLKNGEELTPIGTQKISGSYRDYVIGSMRLAPGRKQLVVRFANDAMEGPKQDRNWWLRSVQLEELTVPSKLPPKVAIRYSPDKVVASSQGGADAVVVEAFSPNGIQSAELLVDGKPQPLELNLRNGMGRLVFPLLTRSLRPGIHHAQVRVRGGENTETLSEPISFRVVAAADRSVKNRYARAVHLLNRFGYGPEPELLADLLIQGEIPWLKSQLAQSWNQPGEQAAMKLATLRYPNSSDRGAVTNRTLLHLLLTPNPVRSRFVMWTDNHFSTWIQKTEAGSKWQEHERFLELGAAPFGDLLFASATSPAMLVYLDQYRSVKGRLNENYAREIMELHTVGVHGGYSQDDVTNLAGLLTGWTLSSDAELTGKPSELVREFRYEPAANSDKAFRIFGMEFPERDPANRFDRARGAIEMLAAHPATAQFISRKLAEHYVSAPAPETLVKRLAQRFGETGGDLPELLVTIAQSPEFWATQGQPKFATPLDYGLRLCRQSGTLNPEALGTFLNKSGMGLFDCATPDGYPELDAAYADSNAMLQRWNFAKVLQGKMNTLVPANLANAEWTPELQQMALDWIAIRLFGQPLGERSNQAALNYLQQAQIPEKDRFRLAATFITQLPENNLR